MFVCNLVQVKSGSSEKTCGSIRRVLKHKLCLRLYSEELSAAEGIKSDLPYFLRKPR